jgi:hypothetical protein
MTAEAQRIAIAEACGHIMDEPEEFPSVAVRKMKHANPKVKNYQQRYEIPNYLNDLNAMHEAEKVLTGKQWDVYCACLDRISRAALPAIIPCWEEINPSRIIDAFQIHATADQRAEAFLRTLGLWKD